MFNHLKQFTDTGVVVVVFESEVDKPFEVVDTYGRFIGNIVVNGDRDINTWLVENGWCSPAFYTSMSNEEIDIFLKAWVKGKKIKGRTSKSISKIASTFNWDLVYGKPGTIQNFMVGEDKGKTIMPKIFRRQVAWMVAKKAKVISAGRYTHKFKRRKNNNLVSLFNFR